MSGPARSDNPRAAAMRVLARIDDDGAYANLALAAELGRSSLERRDRAMVTALVDGTTRMRRACDHLTDRFVSAKQRRRGLEPVVRRALRLGAYQLAFMRVPAHAAVSATVAVAPRRATGLVNAVLRRVADSPLDPADPSVWPDEATRLSYPDWIVSRLSVDLGVDDARAALAAMNDPASATTRDDGYVQDAASRAVVDVLDPRGGERIVDLCAAPGGKATAMAGRGAHVIACDHTRNRAGLIVANATRTGTNGSLDVVVTDGRRPGLVPGSFDAVLLDAPCSGLGSLRRRADARWRITEPDVARLATLQSELAESALDLVTPGGRLVYSVCTLTAAETVEVDARLRSAHPGLVVEPLGSPWDAHGVGGRLLPGPDGNDGMTCFRYRVTAADR